MKVRSVLVPGNGAYVLHHELSKCLAYYSLDAISPRYSLFPPAQMVLRQPADIVHGVPDAGYYPAYSNSALVLTFHNYYLDIENMPFASLMQKVFYRHVMASVVRGAVSKANTVLAVSEYTARLVREHLGCADVDVVLNGVDEKMFVPKSTDNKRFTLLFAGNPTRRKGADFLVSISKALPPNTVLQCTGGLRGADGSLKMNNIACLPAVSHEDMPAIYQQADALFLPTHREGLCLAVLEAMACGLPIITTNNSSMPELVEHGKGGFLFEGNNIEEALLYINLLAKNRTLGREMGAYNRETVLKKFCFSRMVKDYDERFREVYRRG